MDELRIHADRAQAALVHGGSLPWIASPESGVERRMLERVGGEVAIASSIVRYRAGSRFPAHTHALGEEFLVLQGTFSDGRGDYPSGTYVRNPSGSSHAPFSRDGCVIFVKLRQMREDEQGDVCIFPGHRAWRPGESSGHERCVLYANLRIDVTLERLQPGGWISGRSRKGGEEILVVEGKIELLTTENHTLQAWSWLRRPGDEHPALSSATGALLWVKRGHLP